MRTLDKIDAYLEGLDEKKKKKSKKLPFLYTTEDLEGLVDLETMTSLLEKRKVGGPEYDKFYKKFFAQWAKKLKVPKAKSFKDFPKNKQDDFFNALDKAWNAKGE